MRDAPIDGLIQKMLPARPAGSSGNCADENLMAAYLEASLSPREAADFEAHVSKCDSCQEILALAMKLQSQSGEHRLQQPAGSKRMLFRFSIPVPVLGALVVAVVLSAVFLRFPNKPDQKHENPQIAEVRRSVLETQQKELKRTETLPQEPSFVSAKSARMDSASRPRKSSVDAARLQSSGMPKNEDARLSADYRTDLAPITPQLSPEAAPAVPAPASVATGDLVQAFQEANESRKVPGEKGTAAATAKGEVKEGTLETAAKGTAGTVPGAVPVGDLAQRLLLAPSPAPVIGAAQPQQDAPAPATVAVAQAQQVGKAKDAAVDEAASIRVQEAVARPHVYAVQNRIAIAHYTSPSVAASVRLALKDLDSPAQKPAASRKIGERLFYRKSGYWIEKDCLKHPDAAIVEITPEASEYAQILKDYPEIGPLVPALIYWNSRLYLLR